MLLANLHYRLAFFDLIILQVIILFVAILIPVLLSSSLSETLLFPILHLNSLGCLMMIEFWCSQFVTLIHIGIVAAHIQTCQRRAASCALFVSHF